ncbi:tetratricopeptide repeat protein [Mycolicibacterium insubricum]|uniref:Co-chaperone YbbN n=1 Tax=Mycolicibacterium insubricum TaxID=444597 RepID=A0A1X0CXC7_9MYCO|nr:tetratricopeptide repeat protein [Mycolicibacterium insubricum]MCB0926807.1 tetratricopeptide repeat protein [Mycobacterium sp.]MCV7083100.1 tetratricopeptide repeat protein [Mycolicibacterium insubricum]ORA64753.1 co-chaperone YbbN [Mycolicibacterium insubricum]
MTRPRPSRPAMAASMAGAVDLSGLKQRATQPPAPQTGEDTAAGLGAAVAVTEANFEPDVLVRSNQVPVVVLLWSPRSDAAIALAEALGALVTADGGRWSLALVNVDTTPRVAQAFGVQAIPTVVALAGGQPIASFQGTQPVAELRKWVDALLEATAGKLPGAAGAEPEQVDPAVAAARDQLDAGEFLAARASYQAILDADPNHAEAKAAIRQVDWLIRASAADPDVIATADADPGDLEAALTAADVQLLSQDAAGAFGRLIAAVKRTAGDDRARVKARLLELFELFDPADPDVIRARRDLASALY